MNINIQKITQMVKKMDSKEHKIIIDLLKAANVDERIINDIEKEYAQRHYNYTIASINSNENMWIKKEYRDELDKVSLLLNDSQLREKVKSFNILLHGPTGTGKSSFVQTLKEFNKNIMFVTTPLESLLSSKYGQTQINLLTYANKLNKESANKNTVLFIDEIDSLVSSRTTNNDVGEHARIVSTFIKFLDALNDNITVIAATNIPLKIDKAIIRRFNIKIASKTMKQKEFISMLKDNSDFHISSHSLNLFEKVCNHPSFTISDYKHLMEDWIVESKFKKIDPLIFLFKKYKNNCDFSKVNLTERKITTMRKAGLHV